MYFIRVQDLKKTTELKSTSNYKKLYLGLLEYNRALSLQAEAAVEAKKDGSTIVFGLEHPAVLTLGYRAHESDEILATNKIPVVKISRGGLATIHSEGQLIIYPILDLQRSQMGVKKYVEILLLSTQQMLEQIGIVTLPITENAVGLFTNSGKIAFCGIQIKEGVSQHGLSINVNNDLSLFDNIISCGVSGQRFDRVSNYNSDLKLENLFDIWYQRFTDNMSVQQ